MNVTCMCVARNYTDTQTKNKNLSRKGVKKMKKFTKLFLSCALVSAMAVTAAASAFAAAPSEATYAITGDLTGTYTTSSNDITSLKVGTTDVELEANSQVTFIVYKEGADTTELKAEDVLGIDQGTTVQPENKGLKANGVEETEGVATNYIVKVGYTPKGGDFTVAEGKFTVGKAATPAYIVGDANMDQKVDLRDGTAVVLHFVKTTLLTGVNLQAADANLDNAVDLRDGTAIVKHFVKLDDESSPVGKPPAAN